MIDVKGGFLANLRESTVFAAVTGPLDDVTPEGSRNAWDQEFG
jgi:hypothetical protein